MKRDFCAGLLVLALLFTSGLACGQGRQAVSTDAPPAATAVQDVGSAGRLPIVRFLSPPDGTQVTTGSQVYLQVRAFARGGLSHVSFAANGADIGTQSVTGGARLYTGSQAWTPSATGSYTLSATAHDISGQTSAPVEVTVSVQQTVAPEPGGAAEQPAEELAPTPPPPTAAPADSGGQVVAEPTAVEQASGSESGGEAAEPSVSFRADSIQVAAGESTVLRWDVERVREVYLDGQGVVGHGSREVWPSPPLQRYVLHVVFLSGEGQDHAVTVEVSGEAQEAGGPNLVVLAVDCPDTREPDEPIPFQLEVLNAGDTAAQFARWRWTVAPAGAEPGPWNPGDRFDLEPGQTIILRGTAEPHPLGHWTLYADVTVDGDTSPNDNAGSDALTVMGEVPGPQPPPPVPVPAPVGEAPWAPVNCAARPVGSDQVWVEWGTQGQSPPIDGFRIYLALSDLVAEVAGPTWAGSLVQNLEPNTSYHLDVRAYNAAGESPAGACEVDVTTESD